MKYLLTVVFILNTLFYGKAQDTTIVLSASMFNKEGKIQLGEMEHWLYKQGNDPSWADPGISVKNWQHLNPADITKKNADRNGRLEGWFRLKIKVDSSFNQTSLFIIQRSYLASDIFINGKPFYSFGNTGYNGKPYSEFTDFSKLPDAIKLEQGKELLLAVHFVDYTDYKGQLKESSFTKNQFIGIANSAYVASFYTSSFRLRRLIVLLTILCVLAVLFWFLFFLNQSEEHLLFVAVSTTSLLGMLLFQFLPSLAISTYNQEQLWGFFATISFAGVFIFMPLLVAKVFKNYIPRLLKFYAIATIIFVSICFFTKWDKDKIYLLNEFISFLLCTYYLIVSRKLLKGAKWAIVIGLILTQLIGASMDTINNFKLGVSDRFGSLLMIGSYLAFPLSLLVYVALRIKEVNRDVLNKAEKIVQVTEEKKELLASQNKLLEEQVKERTTELTQSLEHLKATQSQLIQSEKMASLGELTAGIAHEIQNPLNFVNNFSEVNLELIEEIKSQKSKLKSEEVEDLLNDIAANEEKINHHGKRADAIVKGMLQHSHSTSGVKEPTDINALTDEYLRLAYHGLRAKDNSFNATLHKDFDESIGSISIIPQDIGRVILNLITNAFYAVDEKSSFAKASGDKYEPIVEVSTKQHNGKVEIIVKDNGTGIPTSIIEKIFQPFFTTKPTGQGTGLGLSLSYDIVKAHGGELKVETKENEGTEFIIQLPI